MNAIKIGLIGGSGLGQALTDGADGRRHAVDTPFGPPSDDIIETTVEGVPALLLSRHGPGHLLNPSAVPYRANLFALKKLGCTHVLASGAVGSLREDFRPRELAVPDQIIDKTARRPGTFYEAAAVHVEMAEPFCPVLRKLLLEAAGDATVHNGGTYICMEGPAFGTRAESLMHRLWGGDLIGMTAMPEAKLAKEAELPYAHISLITDYDAWRVPPPPPEGEPVAKPDPSALLKEIIGNLNAATGAALELMRRAVGPDGAAGRRAGIVPGPAGVGPGDLVGQGVDPEGGGRAAGRAVGPALLGAPRRAVLISGRESSTAPAAVPPAARTGRPPCRTPPARRAN